ncbi:MAG: NAD(P)/FAD-dependent oxidoreductase [Candidatus Marinarcus sp.]|uniref:NAD(P)/FAD-dependent oxidoreductase n=1 Tax=Candidatus Marinarcus sp. TaxID=3100987 RepID=UPI003B001F5B
MNDDYDVIVVGAGAAGMIAAICAARDGKKVLLLEQLSKIGAKLKATGGGRCNLTNTLDNETFMSKFGKQGRFMQDALYHFDNEALIEFFRSIGVQTHAPDGFRVFPVGHNSSAILAALENELKRVNIHLICSAKVEHINSKNNKIAGVRTTHERYSSSHVIIATGGLGYPILGANGDGYTFAKELGHKVTTLHPAMMPLHTKETWVASCKANTIAKATLKVNLPKYKKIKACGDLIFTSTGIRGPVVLDFARDVTPILEKHGEVPLLVNLTKGLNEEQIFAHLKNEFISNPQSTILENISTLLPLALSGEIAKLCEIDGNEKFKSIEGHKREKLVKTLAWTPLTIIGHDGFKNAMITRGGVDLKGIDPKTMQSRIVDGLYFCGEVMNLDGPCGGYNLQWSFSSGYLAGKLG